jgi:hypothetical protein
VSWANLACRRLSLASRRRGYPSVDAAECRAGGGAEGIQQTTSGRRRHPVGDGDCARYSAASFLQKGEPEARAILGRAGSRLAACAYMPRCELAPGARARRSDPYAVSHCPLWCVVLAGRPDARLL